MKAKKKAHSKSKSPKKATRKVAVPAAYRNLKALRRKVNIWDPYDFAAYLEARLKKLKPETVLAIAKFHRMRNADSDPSFTALWLAETIFEKSAWK
ncbi:MAG: hypothetical protein R3D58_07130 [Saprospiraceae bacterium]|nr:hypothetical protein [Lewinellaceae bacterium]